MTTLPLATLSPSVEAVVRIGYGALLLLQLVATAPNARRFFGSERYGGYVESTPFIDRWHRPHFIIAVFAFWILAALGIVSGVALLPAAAVNFLLARYFYVQTRWQSILRGMGAPGHMNHWLAALILFLALADSIDVNGILRAVTIGTFRIDFAAIMIAAGVYKLTAGYARGDGFERGLVNPWWGFHARRLRNLNPHGPLFRVLNHAGYLGELVCGVCFLIPPLAPYAAIFLGVSFLLIGLAVRLTWLAEMVAVCCLFMIPAGNSIDGSIAHIVHALPVTPFSSPQTIALASVVAIALAVYLAILPFAYAGMMWNLYAKRRLPSIVQRALDAWTGFFGLILWRVFTADIIDFFTTVEIREIGSTTGTQILAPWDSRRSLRYRHVGEFICLASLFTTLKYYPGDPELFSARLTRYARTLPNPKGGSIVFRYTRILKKGDRFEYVPAVEFTVNPASGIVTEDRLDPSFDPRLPAPRSPVFAGRKPGSYAPALETLTS